MIEALILSLTSTWVLELGFAWMMNLRTKDELLLVLLVNFITNPVVVCLYWLLYRNIHPVLLTIVLETGAILVEALYYRSFSKQVTRPWLFSLFINLFSYLTGVLIQMI